MNIPSFEISDLFDASVHIGHKKMYWHPNMSPYIYGTNNNIHIIDLRKTVPLLNRALKVIHDVVAKKGRVLFVATKRQAVDIVKEEATRCGQYYMNQRWLGGLFTNWPVILSSIKNMNKYEQILNDPEVKMLKKEKMQLMRKYQKMQGYFSGIVNMGGTPDIILVIDVIKDGLAVREANKMNIPVIAVVDTNVNPINIDYPIPGNDDSARSIQLYCKLFADAAISGIKEDLRNTELAKNAKDDASQMEIKELSEVTKKPSDDQDKAEDEKSQADSRPQDDDKKDN